MYSFCSTKKIVKKNGKPITICDETKSQLIEILHKIQEKHGYISDDNMQKVASDLNIHPVEVYSVISFYEFFTTKRTGKNVIRVSGCISNEMAGNKKVIEAFEKKLKIKCGKTTKDKKFTLLKASCLGMCDKPVAIMLNKQLIGNVKPKDVPKILKSVK